MTTPFLHELPDWEELIRVVAVEIELDPAMVEKDYWVVHSLWAIRQMGWGVYFKGGTSLSKGYGIIKRFSEDLDLRVDPPVEWALPRAHNWKSEGRTAMNERRTYFDRVGADLRIPGCRVSVAEKDRHFRALKLRAEYHEVTGSLPPPLSGGVLLELGNARVTPSELRPIQSWAMEFALRQKIRGFLEVQPLEIHCIRPEVTLLEKIEAIARRYSGERDASEIIRHFEDCASIIAFMENGKDRDAVSVRDLYYEMLTTRDNKLDYSAEPSLLAFDRLDRNHELEQAWSHADAMHWGERRPVLECMKMIRKFVKDKLIRELM